MAQRHRNTELTNFLAAWDAAHGAPCVADEAWARHQLDLLHS